LVSTLNIYKAKFEGQPEGAAGLFLEWSNGPRLALQSIPDFCTDLPATKTVNPPSKGKNEQSRTFPGHGQANQSLSMVVTKPP